METIDRPEGFKEKTAQLVLSRVINPKPFRLTHGNTANPSGKMVAKNNHQTDRQDTSTLKTHSAETVAENNHQTGHQYASNTLDDSKEPLPNGDYSVDTESAETANLPKQPWMENTVDSSELPF